MAGLLGFRFWLKWEVAKLSTPLALHLLVLCMHKTWNSKKCMYRCLVSWKHEHLFLLKYRFFYQNEYIISRAWHTRSVQFYFSSAFILWDKNDLYDILPKSSFEIRILKYEVINYCQMWLSGVFNSFIFHLI